MTYTIHADGQLIFSTASDDTGKILLNPKLSLDTDGSGSLSFLIPPGHTAYNTLRKMKSIITVRQDGEIIFRGRVLDNEQDMHGQKDVYVEGDRSFLMDSLCAPYTYSGTAAGLFTKLINDHNGQVDTDKRFTIGNVTAVSASDTLDVENVAYWETGKEIDEKLLSAFGGYMRTRTEGGTTYMDWLAVSGRENAQTIQFAVNLLDIKDKADASSVFTVLIPLGAEIMGEEGEYEDPVDVTSVNGGKNYIQDDAAVEKYGKIWRTKTWGHIEDPAKLLDKGREYLTTGIELKTLNLKAVDMHFIDSSASAIRIGDHVRIVSDPHGLDVTIPCVQMEIDLLNPENTMYVFGEPPRTLTENVKKTEKDVDGLTGGGGGRSVKKELKDYIRWADIRADADEALIELLTGQVSDQGNRLSRAEITLDGVNAQIALKADLEITDDLTRRINAAEIEIDGANAQISLKASQTVVDELGERVTAAEIEIDGLNSEITLKADKITLQGYVTASQLATEFANFESGISDSLYVSALSANGFECSSFKLLGYPLSLSSATFLTSGTTLSVTSTGGTVTGVTLNKRTDTIYYMSWE